MNWYLVKVAKTSAEQDVIVFIADNKADILAAQGIYGAQHHDRHYTIATSEEVYAINPEDLQQRRA